MRKGTIAALCIFLLAFSFLSLLYSQSSSDTLKGEWSLAGKDYKGKMTILHENGIYKVYGTAPKNYNAEANFDGSKLTFSRTYAESPGFLWSILSIFGIKNKASKVTINHSYTLGSDGKSMKGRWKDSKGKSGEETLTKIVKIPVVKSISPAELEVGQSDFVVTITGENFPEKTFLKPEDFWFTFDIATNNSEKDGRITIREILEVSDDGTQIKAKITVWKNARDGARRLYLKDAAEFARFSVVRPVELLPLGDSKKITGEWTKIFIPIENGDLSLSGAKILEVREGSKTGQILEKTDKGYKMPGAGYFFIKVDGFINTISNTYKLAAETPPDKTPWTFWYFPFAERSGSTCLNLYDDGGVYEKLDKLLGIKGKDDGWKTFRPSRHMDDDYKDSRIQKLAEKYYKSGSWTEPENAGDLEFLKKHNPTTIKGFAWSYQRSEDSNKSWWGHCWGAVVASSLYAEPSDVTLKDADGHELRFTQEEVEGVLTSYHTNHSIFPTNYMNRCPSGKPSDKKNEPWDSYIDDFFLGLLEGIGKQGLPLACNLRAESTDEKRKDEIWNHVVYKYDASLKQAGGDDPTVIKVQLKIWASDDRHPSLDSNRRTEEYSFTLKFNESGEMDRDNKEFQNWISATHYTPSYLWRIQRSSTGRGCENDVMDPLFKKLDDHFKFKAIK